ncbi:MAG TPA: fibronectin type III domain-containing protein [Chryseosolibacter sp.]
MKKIVGLWVYLLVLATPAFSQVDTSYIYNTAMPYGTLDLRIAKSETRYYYLQEDVTFSFRESAPGVKTNTFHDMTSWNSDPYRQGNLREKNGAQDLFVMNYRLLFPKNYNPDYDPGYPIIIMLHGYGERGNCWNNNCYWSTTGWNPNTNSPPAPTSATHNLLNNDHNLLHGGLKHLDAVNLAGNRLPNDPSMPEKAFPGFVLFPQVLNGWQQTTRVEEAIKLLRLVIKKYNIDENRVYIHALSNGGGGLFQAIKRAPWLFAAALPMSAVSNGGIFTDNIAQEVGKIPLWIFQGGKDTNPTPSRTYGTVKGLREAGASIRYSLYPHLGHGTWNTAYNEPDFFPWILSKRKYNPHVYYGNPVICNTNGVGVRISFSNGFFAYQWEHDGVIIPGANQSQYIANTPGTYRGRFSRVPNPSENDWEPWSDEIVVTEISPAKPTVTALGSTHLRGPGLVSNSDNNTVKLKSDQEAELYLWYKNGVQINFPGTDVNDTLRTASFTSAGAGANGAYTLRTSFAFCPSPPSDPINLYFNNSAPQNMTFNAAAAEFKGVPMNNGIFLTWNDLVSSESGYEIWRRRSGEAEFKFAGRAPKNSISFFDGPLQPSSAFEYKIRAVANTGVSNYVPSNDLTINLVVNTPADTQKPQPPQELKVTLNTISSFTISWKKPEDNTGISSYLVSYGTNSVNTNSNENSFTISGLPANTTYPVTVRAVDHAGNISEASNQIIGGTYVMGLFYKHSTGGWEDLDDPTLIETWANPEFTGTVSNVTLAPRTQEDFFNFSFSGYIDILTEGPYVFRLTSNDGSRLFIDNVLVIDNNGLHGNVTKLSEELTLTKGPHRIELHYFDYAGTQTLTLQYKGPDLTAAYKNIPDSLYRSGKFVAPVAPPTPQNLAALANGLERVDLTWTSDHPVEIYRSTSPTGTFSIIGTTASGVWADTTGLNPGTTYYYKARALSAGAMSDYTLVASATTLTDTSAPSVPGGITLANKSHTNAALTWTPSTDNAAVKHYEIYVNGTLAGTTELPAFMVSDLSPGTTYTVTVVAVDASGNKSAASVGLSITTNPAATYYSMATGNLNSLGTWKQFSNGTGNSPVDFTENGLVFIIANRTSTGLGGPWDVSGSASKVIVPNGVTLTVDNLFVGKLELEGNAVVNINNENIPVIGKASAASTVNFNVVGTIPVNTYGNLSVSAPGIISFDSGITTIAGNLTVSSTSVLKGASGNESQVVIGGNILQNTTAPLVAADNRVYYSFSANTPHTISTAADFLAYAIDAGVNSTITMISSSGPWRMVLGSLNGGGLSLQAGSTLNLGASSVNIVGNGSLNPSNETGVLQLASGDFRIASAATQTSNLYLHPVDHSIDSMTVDLSAGQLNVRSAIDIQGALIISRGTLNSGGFITLKATEVRTASLGEIGEGASYQGNLHVEQYIPHVQNQRVDLATGVAGVTVANWQSYFPVTGAFAGASPGSTDPSMFTFDGSSLVPYPEPGGSNSAAIEQGKGYQATISNPSPVLLESIGEPHQGSITPPVIGNPNGSADGGWNLVGNPYASSIVWSDTSAAFTTSGIANSIAIRESKIVEGNLVSQYNYYSSAIGRVTIPAGRAFWVRAYSQAPSLTIHEKAKGATSQPFEVKDEISHLRVTLRQNAREDHTYIYFSEYATESFDPDMDFPKRANEGIFNVSTVVNGVSLAVNALGSAFCNTSAVISIADAPVGSYTFVFGGVSSLEAVGEVSLVDAFTNTTVPLTTDYAFSITSDPASYSVGRFTIQFTRSQLDLTTPKPVGLPSCSDSPAIVQIQNSQAGVEYSAMNNAQQAISGVSVGNGETITIEIPFERLVAGDNVISIRAGFAGCNASFLNAATTVHRTDGITIDVEDDTSVCLGEVGQLSASGVPAGGYYRWYDETGAEIPGATSATLQTEVITGEVAYQVSGILANGCETARQTIRVYADTLRVPTITMYRDTLFAQADASFQWYRNGNPVIGATETYLVPNQTGDYYVVATSSGCSKQSLPYTHVIDPACQLNTSLPRVTLESVDCQPEDYILSITNSLPDVTYSVININDETISQNVPGNNQVLLLSVASSSLDSGVNRIRIRVEKDNCVNRTLDNEININNIAPLTIVTTDSVWTCLGAPATVSVSGGKDAVAYQWYDADDNKIQGATDSVFNTPAISTATAYFVSAQHVSECMSPKAKVVVVPLDIASPVISVNGGELSVNTSAATSVQWLFEGQAIEGATLPQLKPTKSGNYVVNVSAGQCEVQSAPYMYVVTALENTDLVFQLHAYPTPSNARDFGIKVHSPETGPILIQVVDMTGRVLVKKWFDPKVLASKVSIAPDLENGLYSIIASQGDLEIRKRIVIQN